MRILVLGCGSIGRRHAANVALAGELGVCDVQEERAREIADTFGGVALDRAAALDWRPDAAIVATPTDQHVTTATWLIEAGIPVLVEKPISHDDTDAATLLAKADALGVPLFVACNMRYHIGPATLQKAITAIGKPLFLRAQFGNYLPSMRPGRDYRELYAARRSAGGGVIFDSIHEVDYATWLFGDIRSVSCEAGRLSELDIDVEDYAVLCAEHTNGARSEIHLDYLQQAKRRGCELIGSEGTLVWTSEGKQPERLDVRLFTAGERNWRSLADANDVDPDMPYRVMLDAFLQRVSGKTDGPCLHLLDGAGALKALRVCMAAHRAARTGARQNLCNMAQSG